MEDSEQSRWLGILPERRLESVAEGGLYLAHPPGEDPMPMLWARHTLSPEGVKRFRHRGAP